MCETLKAVTGQTRPPTTVELENPGATAPRKSNRSEAVRPFAKVFASMFDREPKNPEAAHRRQIHREWDRQRARALSPSDRDEIDAIFARHL